MYLSLLDRSIWFNEECADNIFYIKRSNLDLYSIISMLFIKKKYFNVIFDPRITRIESRPVGFFIFPLNF